MRPENFSSTAYGDYSWPIFFEICDETSTPDRMDKQVALLKTFSATVVEGSPWPEKKKSLDLDSSGGNTNLERKAGQIFWEELGVELKTKSSGFGGDDVAKTKENGRLWVKE